MGSKKKVSKKVKPKVNKPARTIEGFIVYTVIALCILGIIISIYGFLSKKPKPPTESPIEVGQCYLDRSYQPVRVTSALNYIKEAIFEEMDISEDLGGSWILRPKHEYLHRTRTFEFIRNNYVKIPCDNLLER